MRAAWLPPGAADALRLPRRRLATVPYSHATPHTTTPIVGDRFASARECLRFFLRNPVIRSPSSPRALHAGTGIDWLPAAANLTQGPSIATPRRPAHTCLPGGRSPLAGAGGLPRLQRLPPPTMPGLKARGQVGRATGTGLAAPDCSRRSPRAAALPAQPPCACSSEPLDGAPRANRTKEPKTLKRLSGPAAISSSPTSTFAFRCRNSDLAAPC